MPEDECWCPRAPMLARVRGVRDAQRAEEAERLDEFYVAEDYAPADSGAADGNRLQEEAVTSTP